jgi:crotonobetainyl-CoA:carnitine CoA-transferase CaiB-like acyl-CoA transferase
MQATVGILAALNHRNNTGEGQHVEVNLMLTALAAMANHSSTYIAGGEVPFRMGNSHPSLFPYEPLPAKDGDIIIVAANNAQFAKLCKVLDLEHLLEDERFIETRDRNVNRAELKEYLVEALAKKSVQEWFKLLTAEGVACGPINTIQGGVELAKDLGLDPVVEVGENKIPMIRNAIGFSKTPAQYLISPPELGNDNEAVKNWLRNPSEGES